MIDFIPFERRIPFLVGGSALGLVGMYVDRIGGLHLKMRFLLRVVLYWSGALLVAFDGAPTVRDLLLFVAIRSLATIAWERRISVALRGVARVASVAFVACLCFVPTPAFAEWDERGDIVLAGFLSYAILLSVAADTRKEGAANWEALAIGLYASPMPFFAVPPLILAGVLGDAQGSGVWVTLIGVLSCVRPLPLVVPPWLFLSGAILFSILSRK